MTRFSEFHNTITGWGWLAQSDNLHSGPAFDSADWILLMRDLYAFKFSANDAVFEEVALPFFLSEQRGHVI